MKLLGVVEVVEDFCAKNLLRRGDILFRLQKSIKHLLEYSKTLLLWYSSFFWILRNAIFSSTSFVFNILETVALVFVRLKKNVLSNHFRSYVFVIGDDQLFL